jgi:hypothetical protein
MLQLAQAISPELFKTAKPARYRVPLEMAEMLSWRLTHWGLLRVNSTRRPPTTCVFLLCFRHGANIKPGQVHKHRFRLLSLLRYTSAFPFSRASWPSPNRHILVTKKLHCPPPDKTVCESQRLWIACRFFLTPQPPCPHCCSSPQFPSAVARPLLFQTHSPPIHPRFTDVCTHLTWPQCCRHKAQLPLYGVPQTCLSSPALFAYFYSPILFLALALPFSFSAQPGSEKGRSQKRITIQRDETGFTARSSDDSCRK